MTDKSTKDLRREVDDLREETEEREDGDGDGDPTVEEVIEAMREGRRRAKADDYDPSEADESLDFFKSETGKEADSE